ncbi:thioesterase [Pseudonocardia eucalypti]|uniref:Thioesterase n=1 Tax=Pseudonocardia eucalypti TaxID=648755 RepID=A0ABP9R6H5_9PSEU|nr:pimeloyl-ACP methyl ester carboxylesterase [Pseudonocardia eucalypti]
MRTKQDRPGLAVLLPGTGSDEVFVRASFEAPLRAVGIPLLAPPLLAGGRVPDGYRRALDRAAADPGARPLLVGGVSLGAQVAVRWAAEHAGSGAVAGLLLALPAWTGQPGNAPAALAARLTADAVGRDGLAVTLAQARAETPDWLGRELTRAWTRHGAGLTESLRAAAAEPGPTEAELAGLPLPVGLVGMADDPVHPLGVAGRWHDLLPRAALVTSTLTALGADRESLGRAAVLAWLRATRRVPGAAVPPGAAGPG